MKDALAYAQQKQTTYLAELTEFLQIPSVSTDDAYTDDVRWAATWLAEKMRAAGLEHARLIETERHPLVYADWLHAGEDKPTVLIYGHYDVQPPDPVDLWDTPPFAPQVRDGFVYARGAADDKGQLYIHVKAVEAVLKTNGRLPVNVKFIIEGEEECGGASIAKYVAEHPDELAADVALVSDTHFVQPGIPTIVYGLRGMVYTFLDIVGPQQDLHSGGFGGGIDNPLNVLGHMIAKLKDENGRILIPGFYDDVRQLSEQERAVLADFPFDEAAWLAETGAPQAWGEPDYSLVERLGARPTLDVHGIVGGYTGAGSKTVLPSKVHAKISMRLVPDQDPAKIFELYKTYVESIAPPTVTVTVTREHFATASMTDLNEPAMKAAVSAYAAAFGREPVFMREGGSIPVVGDFTNHLGIETILMGFGLPGDNLHAPNERFSLDNFYRGIETSIRFLHDYANPA